VHRTVQFQIGAVTGLQARPGNYPKPLLSRLVVRSVANLEPAREALGVGDVQRGIPLFVNGVGGPGAYERPSDADKSMNLDNVASYQADATTKRPKPVFTCDLAKAISAPTLLSNGERSRRLFLRVLDQLEIRLPKRERVEIAAR
jgi:non-heme chloroperoxidase